MTYGDPSRPGQMNGQGDALANFRRKFTLEVDSLFKKLNQADMIQQVRSLEQGHKSAVFDQYGRLDDADYHVPGQDIDTDKLKHGQISINIDGLCYKAVPIYELDEKMAHYDARAPVRDEIAYALARKYHSNVFATAINAARMTGADLKSHGFVEGMPTNGEIHVTGNSVHSRYNQFFARSAANWTGQNWVDTFFAAAQRMDELDIPKDGRMAVLRPEDYYRLAQEPEIVNVDNRAGATGLAEGKIMRLAGFDIMQTNWLPNNVINGTAVPAADGSGPRNQKSVGASPASESESGNGVLTVFNLSTIFVSTGTTVVTVGGTVVTNWFVSGPQQITFLSPPANGVNNIVVTSFDVRNTLTPNVIDLYGGNFTLTRGLFTNKRAIGTVKLMDMATEINWDWKKQAHIFIAKYAVGHGILRPDCIIEARST